ncbi:MAG: hypothetical protein M3069_33250 [Chloroflexota bacterium]|nr:hypothetical protein [Chloroflexota bacterium]
MSAALDLKHVGLIVSAGAAVGLRLLSDFGLATIRQNATAAGFDLQRESLGSFGALVVSTLVDALQRDWFNLSPQTPPQVIGMVAGLVGLYLVLRRALAPEPSVVAVLLITPFLPLAATVGACAWVVLGAARST